MGKVPDSIKELALSTDPSRRPRAAMYRKELLRGRVMWPGMTLTDMVRFYVFQKHPLLSISMAHQKDPLARRERLFILAIDFCVRFWISMSFTLQAHALAASDDPLIQSTALTPFQQSMAVAVVTNLLHTLSTKVAIIDDLLCPTYPDTHLCRRFGGWLSETGLRVILGANGVAALILASIGLAVIGVDPQAYAITLGVSMLHSFTWMWLGLAVIFFGIQYLSDKSTDSGNEKKGFRLNISEAELKRFERADIDDPSQIERGIEPALFIPASVDPTTPQARDPNIWDKVDSLSTENPAMSA